MRAEDQYALNMSLRDAHKCARRLSRCSDSTAHDAALAFIRELRKLGAEYLDERQCTS